MTRDEEEARLEAAMQRGDELLVDSLRNEDKSRRRWRRGLVLGGLSVLFAGLVVNGLLNSNQRPPAPVIEPMPQLPRGAKEYQEPSTGIDHAAALATLADDNWRRAFAVGGELAKLPPEQSWPILQANWAKIPNFEARQQILKAFAFARLHPRVLDVMHLGMTDPEPQVRAWAAGYLRGLAFEDFAEDSAAYEEWRTKTAGRPAADVVAESAAAWVGRLKAAAGEQVKREAGFVGEVQNDLMQIPAARDAAIRAGALDVAAGWLRDHADDGDIVAGARDLLAALKPDEAYLRRVILPMLDGANPIDVRRAAVQTLGRSDNQWAVDPLLAVLRDAVTSSDKQRRSIIWDVASALAEIGDARAIPDMIAAIAHDNTYDTVYGVGYFGLGKITGVRYDESHDGEWWRQWWERERQRFPEPARSSPIPTLNETRSAESEQSSGAVRPIYAMVMAAPAPKLPVRDAPPAELPVQELQANNNPHMRYFLMGPKAKPAPKDGYRLLLVLPGGGGGADFRDFVESIARQSLSDHYLVAQLVAPQWARSGEINWPIERDRREKPPVMTEAFIDAVVADVGNMHKLDPKHVYALAWSSSGPAVYAAALRPKTPITGAFVAMSVYKPADYPPVRNAKGRSFYLLHSPQDFIRMTFPENARKQLAAAGATVKLQTYEGGHGWHGNPHKMIRAGVMWLESQTKLAASRPATAPATRAAAPLRP